MRWLHGAIVLLVFGFVLPGFAADENKDAKDPKEEKKEVKDAKDEKKDAKDEKKDLKPEPKPKPEPKKDNGMVKVHEMVAQIVTLDETRRTVRVRYEVPKLNVGAANGLAQAQVQLQQAFLKPLNQQAQAIASAQQAIAQHTANLYTKENQEADLTTTEDLVVRMKDPPPKFDDKGKLAKYTAKELAELKGDSKLPGYKGEFGDLHTNQIIQVTLVRQRNLPKPKINPKTKQIDPDTIVDLKPQISVIIILGEPRTPGG